MELPDWRSTKNLRSATESKCALKRICPCLCLFLVNTFIMYRYQLCYYAMRTLLLHGPPIGRRLRLLALALCFSDSTELSRGGGPMANASVMRQLQQASGVLRSISRDESRGTTRAWSTGGDPVRQARRRGGCRNVQGWGFQRINSLS